jgi:2-polyprenyl-6-methoxyphenol hydroxylase-like FAD-dependent oxidoreductase
MAATKPVLISGAGISGLLLAHSLRASRIPYILYERDPNGNARAQGYRLRISSDGINALKAVLTPEEYNRLHQGTAATGGGGIHNLDAITGEPEKSTGSSGGDGAGGGGPGLGGDVLGISRGFLRRCLLDGAEDTIQWGKQSIGYALSESGVTLKFRDGTSSPEGSLLIGADGPQSAITKQLTDGKVRAYDTGARMIHGQTPARAYEGLGEGVWFVQDGSLPEGDSIGLITNVRPGSFEQENDEIGWVFVGSPGTFGLPEDQMYGVGKVAADLSRRLTAKWHEKFHPIFQDQNVEEAAFLKMSTANPQGVPEWQNNPRVTVMGDSVHCMTPAGGVGANTALRDAAFIGRLLKESGGWYSGLTSEYEKEMRVYASENVKMSFEAAARRFNITKLE